MRRKIITIDGLGAYKLKAERISAIQDVFTVHRVCGQNGPHCCSSGDSIGSIWYFKTMSPEGVLVIDSFGCYPINTEMLRVMEALRFGERRTEMNEKKKAKVACMGRHLAVLGEAHDCSGDGFETLLIVKIKEGGRQRVLDFIEEKDLEITNREGFTWLCGTRTERERAAQFNPNN